VRTVTQPGLRLHERPLAIPRLTRESRNTERWLFLGALAVTIALAPAMVFLQLQVGFALTLGLLIAAILTLIMIVWPVMGVYILAVCAVVIEQGNLTYPIVTDHLYVFYWPAQLQGLPERPIGFLALFILLLIIARRLAGRLGAPVRLGPIFWPFAVLLLCVAMGVAHGLATGGDLKIVVLEVRPFWYLFVAYLLAYNLITHKRHALALLWITVLGTFIKALQGTYIVFALLGGHVSGQNEIMAHEQSFFFVLVLLLILMSLMLGRLRPLMWIALISTPFLLIALVANNRRADYVALLIAIIGVWLFTVAVRPKQRAALIWTAVIAGALFSGYVLAFQHSSGAFGSVAHAVVSVVNPSASDARDISSNYYRDIENIDLKSTEHQSPIIGYGFGKPFLQPIPLPNISRLDPYYLYVPHNTLLWVWMRLGPPGFAALWYLVAVFIIRAGIMARTLRDPDLRFMAIFAIGAMLMEIPLAYGDYQLFFYRNIIYLGLLMGAVMRLPALDSPAPASEPDETAPETDDNTDRDRGTRIRALPLSSWERLPLAGAGAPRVFFTASGASPGFPR
jgi:O-antigen ligase/polysaccharide polymerase Wzy-like membrane protein